MMDKLMTMLHLLMIMTAPGGALLYVVVVTSTVKYPERLAYQLLYDLGMAVAVIEAALHPANNLVKQLHLGCLCAATSGYAKTASSLW